MSKTLFGPDELPTLRAVYENLERNRSRYPVNGDWEARYGTGFGMATSLVFSMIERTEETCMTRTAGDQIHIDTMKEKCIFLEADEEGAVILYNLDKREVQNIDGSFIVNGWPKDSAR